MSCFFLFLFGVFQSTSSTRLRAFSFLFIIYLGCLSAHIIGVLSEYLLNEWKIKCQCWRGTYRSNIKLLCRGKIETDTGLQLWLHSQLINVTMNHVYSLAQQSHRSLLYSIASEYMANLPAAQVSFLSFQIYYDIMHSISRYSFPKQSLSHYSSSIQKEC